MIEKKVKEMRVEHYLFGTMTINGKMYENDLIVFPHKVFPNWWRTEGHSLALEDLKEVIEYKPDLLIIGSGASGVMKVSQGTVKALKDQGIEVIFKNTQDVVRIFNKQDSSQRVIGAFHLTC